MSLSAGSHVGPYGIIGLMGAGGMGEVYRARDTKLNRDVALKILPEAFSDDAERLARITREAQTLAALNHPNIAAIYGIEGHALVMELVEGDDLSAHIARGPMPLAEALPIARQIAEALEAAHEVGIIHRDLKPANVKVRADGTVKVLDFGLAKALHPATTSSAEAMNSTMLASPAETQVGVILGTAAYMSPEQARGRPLDRRADIWAFGVVVFEILTGERCFKAQGVSDTLAAVLRQDVDWKALPAMTPPRLRRLLERCLDRDVKTRLRDIGEARIEIVKIEAGAPDTSGMSTPAAAGQERRAALMPWVVAATLGVALVVALVVWSPWAPAQTMRPPMRLSIVPTDLSPIRPSGVDRTLAISPDASHLAYITTGGSLIVRALDDLNERALPGISGARSPFFSPDGKWIGFFQGVTELKKVPITGGPALTVCKLTGLPRGATWGPDDTIVFATFGFGLRVVAASGEPREPKELTRLDPQHGEIEHYFPSFLPGGRAVLFTIDGPGEGPTERETVAVLDLATGRHKALKLIHGSQAQYVENLQRGPLGIAEGGSGYLVYGADGALRAVRFDPKTLEARGDAVPIVEHVSMGSIGATQYGVSSTGALVYVPGGLTTFAVQSLVWMDRKGREEPTKAPPRNYTSLRASPDGTRVALDIRNAAQKRDIWVWDLRSETLTPLTLDPSVHTYPAWTPDSRRIVFGGGPEGTPGNLFWQAADGTGSVEQLTTTGAGPIANSFAPSGDALLVTENNATTRDDISRLAMGTRQITPLIHTAFDERNAEISPDGKWVAYESIESGTPQIYVRPFPDVNAGHWQISTDGGTKPTWAPTGRELFYLRPAGYATSTTLDLDAVTVTTTPGFSHSSPVRLFDSRLPAGVASARLYDVSRDGQRFIVIKPAAPATDPSVTLAPQNFVFVVNWIEELQAKLSVK